METTVDEDTELVAWVVEDEALADGLPSTVGVVVLATPRDSLEVPVDAAESVPLSGAKTELASYAPPMTEKNTASDRRVATTSLGLSKSARNHRIFAPFHL